jgi:hypothetical protein
VKCARRISAMTEAHGARLRLTAKPAGRHKNVMVRMVGQIARQQQARQKAARALRDGWSNDREQGLKPAR